jgi:hypothetical protein
MQARPFVRTLIACASFAIARAANAEPHADPSGTPLPSGENDQSSAVSKRDVAPTAEPRIGFSLDALLGGGSHSLVRSDSSGGVAIGATGLVHYNVLEAGIGLTWTSTIWSEEVTLVTVLVGFGFEPASWLRFDGLVEAGAQTVSGIGRGFLGSDPVEAGSGTLPYVGARAGVGLFPEESRHLLLGWWFGGGRAAGHTIAHVTFQDHEEWRMIGGSSFMTGIRAGAMLN